MLTDNHASPLILIVEDDCLHCDLIKRSFEDTPDSYRLEVAGTLEEAWEILGKCSPDVVLTDYRLPDGDGNELVVKAHSICPVILMTAHGDEQAAVRAMKVGAQDYIVKSPAAFENMPQTVKYSMVAWALTSAHKQAEELVMKAKRDWERTFDAVPDLIAVIDINHTIIRVNKAMAERCGYNPQELIGRKCYEVVHGIDDVLSCCPFLKMKLDGQVRSIEVEEKRLNGVFDITVSPIYDESGSLVSYVHVMRDITARKQSEASLAVSEQNLQRLVGEQRVILNAASVGICLIKGRRVLWGNPYFEKLFGYDTGNANGIDTRELYVDDESYQTVGVCGYEQIDSGGIYSLDVMMKHRNGSQIWCNLTGQAITPGKPDDGSIWLMMDISERKRSEDERQKLELQFQQTQKLESLGVLSGGIAHDFNNILTVILGHCFMVKEEFDSGMTDKAHVEQIESAARRAADLCRQMLAYAGKSPLLVTRFNLWALVDDNVKMLQSAIKKNVAFDLELGNAISEINGDSSQIQQVVMNLIINASEAIGDNNGTIGVKLAAVTLESCQAEFDCFDIAILPGRYVCLTVSDDGCGMDAETRRRIFEPFFTTKFTGRGLGMSAIIGIIKSHNGALQMSSEPGAGTTFKVYLPVPSRMEICDSLNLAESADTIQASGTVLIVDDELALLAIGSALLNAMGFYCLNATNGQEALEVLESRGEDVDLVLLDLIMPKMGGLETYRELRKIYATLPVVICSGYSIEDVPEVFLADPYTTALQKPYSPEQLKSALMKFQKDS